MAGTNPDPAESINVVEVVREAVRASVEGSAKANVEVTRRAIIEAQSAPQFENRVFGLTVQQPILLFGEDRSRVRALVRASTTDVFIGSMSQLQSGFGYPLPTGSGDEIKTTAAVYVIYSPSGAVDANARVAAWVERAD